MMKNYNKMEILSIYPNDSDYEEVCQNYDVQEPHIFDTEDFL
jgi:hypothetical protein